MVNTYLAPYWFFGYGLLLKLAFAIIVLIVSIYAFKVYKISNQKQSRLFGISFLLISLSYFVQALANYAILSKLDQNICVALKIMSVDTLNMIGFYAHIIFFTAGLVTLTYMTLKCDNAKTYALLLTLAITSLIFNPSTVYFFYLLSSILLAFIAVYYFAYFVSKRQPRTLLVLVAFMFLLFGNIHFLFSVNHEIYYLIGLFLELVAYIAILVSLILVVKKHKKSR